MNRRVICVRQGPHEIRELICENEAEARAVAARYSKTWTVVITHV